MLKPEHQFYLAHMSKEQSLQTVPMHLRRSYEFVEAAILKDSLNFRFAGLQLKSKQALIFLALQNAPSIYEQGQIIKNIPLKVFLEPDFIKKIVDISPELANYIPQKGQEDEKIALTVVQVFQEFYINLPLALRNNPLLLLKAIESNKDKSSLTNILLAVPETLEKMITKNLQERSFLSVKIHELLMATQALVNFQLAEDLHAKLKEECHLYRLKQKLHTQSNAEEPHTTRL